MNTITCKVCFLTIVILCNRTTHGSCEKNDTNSAPQQNTVDDFLRQFTTLFRNAINPTSREKELNNNYLNTINQHFSNLQERPPNEPSPLGPGPGQPDYPQAPGPFSPYRNLAPVPPNGGFGQRPGYLQPSGNYPPPEGGLGPNPGFQPPDGNFGPSPSYPPRPSRPPRPGLPPSFPGFGGYPPRLYPPYLPGYRPPYNGGYPHTSLFAALDSISRYDDLRCVPRLLCEVTTGSRKDSGGPGYPPGDKGNSSPIPFVPREALITLLTILNFVDDSPLLSFARAAFLGYSSRGDLQACLTAYPTCPRDPDQLINYLNNHNGGFFRFFNQQLQQQPQYTPQYQQFIQKYQNDNRTNDPPHPSSTEAITPRYHDEQIAASRILNDPIEIEYNSTKISNVPARQQNKLVFQNDDHKVVGPQPHENRDQTYESIIKVPSRTGKKYKLIFQNGDHQVEEPQPHQTSIIKVPSRTGNQYKLIFQNDDRQVEEQQQHQTYNSIIKEPSRTGKKYKLVFQNDERQVEEPQPHQSYDSIIKVPSRTSNKFIFPNQSQQSSKAPSNNMIFPDRTGTGNLVLNDHTDEHYKIVFVNDEPANRKSKKIRFQIEEQRSKRKMKFPQDDE